MIGRQKITFNCIAGAGTKLEESWLGSISYLNHFGSHYEMLIHSRSLIYVLFGKSKHGYFACIPDWQAGCHLVDFKDLFWNTEPLSQVLGEIDGITVAKALYSISDLVKIS
jgi:hypothetical protein